MKTIIITPPVVQFNTPYPSGAYLKAYFTHPEGGASSDSHWYDLNIRLFYSVFSKEGLQRLFELSEKNATRLADEAEKNGDEDTAFNLRRYLSQKENWIEWIDFITSTLRSSGAREKSHQFLFSPFAPRGSRMENYLSGLDREPSVDDVRFLCTFALADLSDYITVAFDPQFSLVRYAESLAVDTRTFSEFEKQIDSPMMEYFYKPVLENLFNNMELPAASGGRAFRSSADASAASFASLTNVSSLSPVAASGAAPLPKPKAQGLPMPKAHGLPMPVLVCISVPFAGTFLPALYTARFFKQKFGDSVFVCIGGGFVNTELREAGDPALAKYIDAISYDRGYGSYKALLCPMGEPAENTNASLYKMRLFKKQADKVEVIEPVWNDQEYEKYENQMTVKIIPDYSDIDFSQYLKMCDDQNAMHRIWTDGSWIKAYLAHGCYWHKCAFCDTSLDYVCGYKITDILPLYNGLLKTAREKNVYGIHFVDEALPPLALKKFALLNARAGNPLYFWGNVRFEKTFTKDFAAFLSYCGLGGVSAGIESATGTGLESINKGTDISSIAHASCAFKEAGILVHAYMIYGFWNDTPQSIIDSMETLRQFFAAGLLDSAFWHKFVLTRNSTVYSQWKKEGKLNLVSGEDTSSAFARNNLHFKGEEKFNKFGLPLETALNSWMHGEGLEQKVQKWFDFPVPSPTVPRNFIETIIEEYEEKNLARVNSLNEKNVKNIWWLGGKPVCSGKSEFRWIYLMEEQIIPANQLDIELLFALRPEASEEERNAVLKKITAAPSILLKLKKLMGHGLVLLDF
ncbi:MAG: radical SAM protein [Spirochaetales bacterium]|nr:radical SAM protein [Spirochaetales bacterium]